ncbi:MAG: hypothetical protein ACRD0U_04025, partial [Acidimicrobiales bacterium]
SRDQPVALVAFDLLWLDGHPTGERPWEERRSLLEELLLSGPAWRTPSAHRGEGQLLLDAAGQQGLAGLVAKRTDSRYEPGRRSAAWRQIAVSRT